MQAVGHTLKPKAACHDEPTHVKEKHATATCMPKAKADYEG